MITGFIECLVVINKGLGREMICIGLCMLEGMGTWA
jgi:hypothetical protein